MSDQALALRLHEDGGQLVLVCRGVLLEPAGVAVEVEHHDHRHRVLLFGLPRSSRSGAVGIKYRPLMSRPLLGPLPISHFSEKVRWALDWKRVPHRRRVMPPGLHPFAGFVMTRGEGFTMPVLVG